MLRIAKIYLFFLLPGLFSSEAYSQLQPSLIFQSGMVIQRENVIPVWGIGNANGSVNVNLNGTQESVSISSDGTWYTELPEMMAGGPYVLTLESDGVLLTYTDVYIGDVWLASGQSNMQMELKNSDAPDAEIDPDDNPEIRQFMVQRVLKNTASADFPTASKWSEASAENIGNYSAVGFYFAKYLYAHLGVPIGIINTSYGGTRIESWMSNEMLGFDESKVVFGDGTSWLQPTVAYNGMLRPLLNVRIKGFIWYQGESNAGSREEAVLYRSTFSNMITSWRSLWDMGDLPFFWVQLPNYNTEANENTPGTWDAWPLIRESQSTALALPNTGEAITLDVGDLDIHPTNKQPVGKRLALIAQNLVYGDTIEYSGPRYLSHRKLPGGKVEITFDHIGAGLVAKNSENDELKWFSLVRSNGTLLRADAVIDNNKVIVWNDALPDPYAIRYAWETNPADVNFYNQAGLPAAPFYIYVDEQALKINTYLADKTFIDRGENLLLRWEVFGSDSLTLNGLSVAAKGALRVFPEVDSVFKLIAYDKENAEIQISKSITITVRQPIPTIELSSNSPEILPLDTSVTVSAAVSREGGGPIEKVEFYLNGNLMLTDTEAPYELEWTAVDTGQISIFGKVYNDLNISTESEVISLYVQELEFVKYEAEDADFKAGARIKSSEYASNGFFLDLMKDWKLTFDSIQVFSDQKALLYIRFMLNYGSPRLQNLYVNDSLIENILFASPDLKSWQDYVSAIPLDSGMNEVIIEAAWDYMSIDYILLGRKEKSIVADTSTIDTALTVNNYTKNIELSVYPNPLRSESTIAFNLPEKDLIELKIFDLKGRELAVLANSLHDAGDHRLPFTFPSEEKGIFVLHFKYKGQLVVKKLVRLE